MKNPPPETGAFFARDREWPPPAFTPIYKTSVARSPQRALLSFDSFKTEITGPAFGHNMLGELDNDLILNHAGPGGPHVHIGCTPNFAEIKGVFGTDLGAGPLVNDKTRGQADPNFTGWARCPSDMTTGEFVFETIKPGRVPFRENDPRLMAPHVLFWIVACGINIGLQTRMYFSDEEAVNAEYPMLPASSTACACPP